MGKNGVIRFFRSAGFEPPWPSSFSAVLSSAIAALTFAWKTNNFDADEKGTLVAATVVSAWVSIGFWHLDNDLANVNEDLDWKSGFNWDLFVKVTTFIVLGVITFLVLAICNPRAFKIAKAAPQIALVGPTPQNMQAGKLGVFLKRAALVNGYPSYTKAGDDGAMLWHAGQYWFVGDAARLGQEPPSSAVDAVLHGQLRRRGFVKMVDGCLRPEASTATWEVHDGTAWIDAPALRCLSGDALAAEIAKAAPRIALVGPTPQNQQADRLGVFLKRTELVNGFPSYTKAGEDGVMLWHAGEYWKVGAAANLGQDRGWVSVRDSCLRPEASTAMWQVYDGTAWVDAPALRCLAGDALDAHAAEIAKAAPRIALVGPTPQNQQADRLGVFLKRTELVNGFPSYTKAGDDGAMLWHAGACWYVGAAADLGQNRGWVKVVDGCLRPEASTAMWQVYNGTAWVDAPALRCRSGDALTAEIAKAAPQLTLVGRTPQNQQADRLGVFLKRTELVNGFPSYTKAGVDTQMLWHAGEYWKVGAAANLGQNRGWVSLIDGCLRPEASTATWQVYDGTAWVDAPDLCCR